jgi:hypothetical protein
MKHKELSLATNQLLTSFILAILTLEGSSAWAATPKYRALYRFQTGSDGGFPNGNLVLDASGNLYGTTSRGGIVQCAGDGGIVGCGIVFELSPPASGGRAWTKTTLYAFSGGTDGATPYDGPILDKAGNLYGTTAIGGTGQCKNSNGTVIGCGTVFEIAPTGSSGSGWSETILYSFQGQNSNGDGAYPFAGLVADRTGNLYGTTLGGGTSGGTVFKLTRPSRGGGVWTETVLYTAGSEASGFYARLILDGAGNLYTTSATGGTDFAGTVFELSPPRWTPTILHSFNFKNGGTTPTTGVIFDNKGNLYGTTIYGGVNNPICGGLGCGVAFRLTPPGGRDGGWTETVIHSFQGRGDGFIPGGCVILDQAGNIYGSTVYGGLNVEDGYGIVYKLTPRSKKDRFAKTIVHYFADHPAEYPSGNLVFEKSGAIYGATALGDSSAPGGVVFKLTVD